MKALALSIYALTYAAAALLAGCGGSQPPIGAPGAMPQTRAIATHAERSGSWLSFSIPVAIHGKATANIFTRATLAGAAVRLQGRQAPAGARRGIYVAQYFGSSVLGYAKNNSGNGPPICSISGVSNVQDLATDTVGNLIVPNVYRVNVYRGPPMCGPPLATISDSYGQATDAAAVNAATGPIVVANMNGPGFVVVCTARSLKCAQLTPPSTGIGAVGGVAMDKNDNCWADAFNAAITGVDLIYWARCTGSGVIAPRVSRM